MSDNNKAVLLTITYSVVTPESAEHGDIADHGVEHSDMECDSLLDAVEHAEYAYGCNECVSDSTLDAESELDYSDGSYTTYSAHFTAADGSPLPAGLLPALSNLRNKHFTAQAKALN